MRIAVVALGKIGLPLAVQFASKGHEVVGIDVDSRTVAMINSGVPPFPGEYGLDALLGRVIESGNLRATMEYATAIPQADAVVLVVPLLVDSDAKPEFDWMDAATRSMAAHLTPGTLISYETTLPVGTTRNRWRPMIEEVSGLREGEDFHLVFSPERVLTGRVFADLRKYPKLIGGLSAEGAAAARQFYESVLDFDERDDLPRPNGVWDLKSAEASEFAKLAETTYRDVNIGLANQFARYAASVDVDVQQVIEACNSQPYSHIHSPGIAVGGHCIPVYPRLYLWNDPNATVVRAAREANAAMPSYAVGLLEGAYGDLQGARVVILGATYRGGVKETAFSGAFPLAAELEARGATVLVHDPLLSDDELQSYGFTPYHLGDPVEAAMLQANHAEYKTLRPSSLPGVAAMIDGRRVLAPEEWEGVAYRVIGAPTAGAHTGVTE